MIHSRVYCLVKQGRILPNPFLANRGRIRNRRRSTTAATRTRDRAIAQNKTSELSNVRPHPFAFVVGTTSFAFGAAVLFPDYSTIPLSTTSSTECETTKDPFDETRLEEEEARLPNSYPFYDFLLDQLRVVQYSEDRDFNTITSDSGRNKPTGLNGLACLHCCGKETNKPLAEEASIFPQDRRSLAREVSTEMYEHVSTCPHCPSRTRAKLRRLYKEHYLPRDSKKKKTVTLEERLLFKQLWYDMGHKDMAPISKRSKKRRRMLINITIER